MAAATMGSGEFALPFIFYKSGWLLCLAYFVVLGGIIIGAQIIYLRTLEKVDEKERLLGLARKYFGSAGFWVGFFAIVIGLLLGFVIYLILGTQFIRLLFPAIPGSWPLFIFWLFISLPVLIRSRRVTNFETFGIMLVVVLIVFIFISAQTAAVQRAIPASSVPDAFLPFGVILFSLAGWTGVEPIYEMRKKEKEKTRKDVWPLILGTAAAALLYIMFAVGILVSAPNIASDTVSGLAGWPIWKRDLIAVLGLVALWTVSMPIAHEIRNALEKDLKWNHIVSRLVIILVPLALILSGFNNFLAIVGITGGLFLSVQYLLIISVGRKVLELPPAQKIFLTAAALVFLVAAVYSVVVLVW